MNCRGWKREIGEIIVSSRNARFHPRYIPTLYSTFERRFWNSARFGRLGKKYRVANIARGQWKELFPIHWKIIGIHSPRFFKVLYINVRSCQTMLSMWKKCKKREKKVTQMFNVIVQHIYQLNVNFNPLKFERVA